MGNIRVGFGTDLHAFISGNGFHLGGVFIPCQFGVRAISDGDVLLHALVDAMLGGAGLGDIGEYFPESKVTKGENSRIFVEETLALIKARGAELVNIDCVVNLEPIRLSRWKAEIRAKIAEILALDLSRVNVKAKTAEGLGCIGRGEAVSAEVVVLLNVREEGDRRD